MFPRRVFPADRAGARIDRREAVFLLLFSLEGCANRYWMDRLPIRRHSARCSREPLPDLPSAGSSDPAVRLQGLVARQQLGGIGAWPVMPVAIDGWHAGFRTMQRIAP